jgi:hypothetical protein
MDFIDIDAAHLAGVRQRQTLIQQQTQLASATRAQTKAIEEQNQIDKDRTDLEAARLQIEQQRLQAEEAERKASQLLQEQTRELRKILARTSADFSDLKRLYP